MRTVLLLSLVALVLAQVEVRGQGVKEVVDEEKEEKYSGQEWDYYEEEVAINLIIWSF